MDRIVFLGMGGTIAGIASSPLDNVGYRVAQVGVEQLVGGVMSLAEVFSTYELVSDQVAQMDSKDLDFHHLMVLTQRAHKYLSKSDVVGLVVTHGTDTLEEAAYFLSRMLPHDLLIKKPVVLTGAMRPASSSVADGPQNMLDAARVVCAPDCAGVMVVVAGVIHSALHVQKVHPYRLDAFDSGEAGPLGYVEEGCVRWVHEARPIEPESVALPLSESTVMTFPRVEIVMNYVGATGATVRALCYTGASGEAPVQGIVVAGTGNGTMHTDLEAALRRAQMQGIKVMRATRCASGRVVPVAGVRGEFPHSNGLPPLKARISLVLELLQQRGGL